MISKKWICTPCGDLEWECDCDACTCPVCGAVGQQFFMIRVNLDTTMGDGTGPPQTKTKQDRDEVVYVAGPEEVNTKTTVLQRPLRAPSPIERLETVEERNDRIWRAIKGASGG